MLPLKFPKRSFSSATGGYAQNPSLGQWPTTDWSLVGAACYDSIAFNLGNPKTGSDWIVHIAGAIVAIFLVWWMLRLYVL
jgi:hypothetical protein